MASVGMSTVLAQTPPSYCSKNKKAIEMFLAAENFRVRGQYSDAVDLLNKVISKDRNFCEAYFKLAQVARSTRRYVESIQLLEKGLTSTATIPKQKVFWLELGEVFLLQGKYREASGWLEKFLQAEQVNKAKMAEAQRLLDNCAYALKNLASFDLNPKPLSDSVNSFRMQYFPVLTADEQNLFFTMRNGSSDRDTEDIMVSHRTPTGAWSKPVSVSSNINSRENEGTCTVSADGSQIIFTSCRGRSGFGNCDLFVSRRTGDRWTDPVNLGPSINSMAWESQPSLSADGRILYFVSDRKGGLGGRDIYRAEKNALGQWKPAENLGSAVNTRFDEISPFIHAGNRTLFFASNGRPGFGGYDIFYSAFKEGRWLEPVNFGSPINNHEDQFAMYITPDGRRGYYSHEENLDQHTGKIFFVDIPELLRRFETGSSVGGKVTDAVSQLPLKADIELVDLKTSEKMMVTQSDSVSGLYLIVLNKGSDYGLFVSKPGYLYKSLNFNLKEMADPPVVLDIALEPLHAGTTMVLRNIFFDYDKFDLRPESMPELENALRILQENPGLRIEISGHTDNIGAETKNQMLSLKRAEAVKSYFMGRGMVEQRIKVVGLGSSRPLVANDSDANRSGNRRIEFRVLP